MSPAFIYRLQILLDQKQGAKKQAEQEQMRREKDLEAAHERLEALTREEKELIAKRQVLQRDLLAKSAGSRPLTGREVLDRSEFVKVVGLQIEEAKTRVLAQRQAVELSERRVGEAQEQVKAARREVEVLTKHRAKQEERFHRAVEAKEELGLDEIGNVLYTTRRQMR